MKMSRARYACLLNSDTKLVANGFKVLVAFMDAHPEAAACGPRLLNPDGTTQSCVRSFAGLGTMILQGLNWHKFFPRGQVSREYYACAFDYSREQQVESLGTTAYVVRRETWETFGMLDERLPHFQVDLAYNLMLKRNGCKIYYTPSAEVIHYGSQSINQMPRRKIIEQHRAMVDFNEHYDYFGKSRLLKLMVRAAVAARCLLKIAEFHLSPDKRVIKGPGAPRLNAIDRTILHREDLRTGAD
jgi:GT2 family glycosyltransferase